MNKKKFPSGRRSRSAHRPADQFTRRGSDVEKRIRDLNDLLSAPCI